MWPYLVFVKNLSLRWRWRLFDLFAKYKITKINRFTFYNFFGFRFCNFGIVGNHKTLMQVVSTSHITVLDLVILCFQYEILSWFLGRFNLINIWQMSCTLTMRFTVKPYILWKSLFHWIYSNFYKFEYGHLFFDLWPHEGC